MIDEQELDEWFADERERLEAAYYSGAEARKDTDQLKVAFDTGLQRLLVKYQDRQRTMLQQQQRQAALHKPIAQLTARRDELLAQAAGKYRIIIESVRAWFFHQRIKRIIRAR